MRTTLPNLLTLATVDSARSIEDLAGFLAAHVVEAELDDDQEYRDAWLEQAATTYNLEVIVEAFKIAMGMMSQACAELEGGPLS